jgi:hypothetical protein
MSAMGQKRTLEDFQAMSALPPKADIGTGPRMTQQLRQLGDIRRDPPRLIFREQLGRRSPARLVLEVDVSELLAVVIAHHITGV